MTPAETPATLHGPYLKPRDLWVGYIRVSTWKEEKISPELQRTAILDWARRNHAEISVWIEDLDTTGRNFKRKIMRAIEIVEKGKERGIALWRYSRFGRDRAGNAINLARVESVGGQLASATEPVDASTAIGRFQRGMILEFAAFESDRIGEAWAETHQHRRSVGLPATGRPRFGYIWHRRWNPRTEQLQEEKYELDLKVAPDVADLYRRYCDSDSDGFLTLCTWLNNHGHRTTRGNLWQTPTLTRYMDSGFAAGLLRVHDDQCPCKGGRNAKGVCRNYHLVQGAHKEAVDFDLWQLYRQRRKEIQETPPRSRNTLYMLTGLTRHAHCHGGTSMTSARHTTTGGERINLPGYAYRCTRRAQAGPQSCEGIWVPRTQVEKDVEKWLVEEAAPGIDHAPATKSEEPRIDERAQAHAARARLQAEHEQIETALTNLITDNARNPKKYPAGAFERARDGFLAQQESVTRDMEQLTAVAETPHRADFELLVVGLAQEWKTLNTREQNAMLKQIVRRVALVRRKDEHGQPIPGAEGVETWVQALWEPDPWTPAHICRGSLGTRPAAEWAADALWSRPGEPMREIPRR
ncbi:recombinase family protein [Streptomyces sp. NPDC017941]|uniref:recombinase family protein n=1 Tax=Streptomyces sp. NPDC017941 TaxID=3365018 RepID=UPI00379BA2B8